MAKTKVQKDKQRSTKHTHKTKNGLTRTPLKTGVNSCALEVQAVSKSVEFGIPLTG